MSGFIPDMWASKCLGELKKRKNLFDLTDRSYETSVKSGGGSVTVPTMDSLVVQDETATEYTIKKTDNSQGSKILLDKKAVITIGVGVIDEVQSSIPLMNRYTKKAGIKTGMSIDTRVAKEFISGSKPANRLKFSDLVANANRHTKSTVNAVQEILNAVCDMDDRVMVVDPKGYKDLGDVADFVDYQKIAYSVDKSPLLTGLIGAVYGFQVFLMPSLPLVDETGVISATAEENTKHIGIFYQKEAFATVIQAMMKAKGTYDPKLGQDVVQLFTVFGAKLLEDDKAVVVRDN